jgi:U5 snRNP spliceosome subunit
MSTAEAVAAINAARASVVKVTDQNVVLAGECAALPKTPVDDVYPLSKVMSEHVDTSTWAALRAIAQLDVALAALTGDVLPPGPSPTPPPEPSPTPPPTPHPDLILERSNVTKTEVLKIGELAGTRTVTGVFEAPPADGKWRKLIGPDSTKGRYGGFCVGLTNEGKLEAWVDDGTTMRQALLGVTPGKGSFFSMRLSSTAMVPAVDDATVAVQLPNGIVEFDGPAYIGAASTTTRSAIRSTIRPAPSCSRSGFTGSS